MIEHKCYFEVQKQIDALLKGFDFVIPLKNMRTLTIEQIEAVLSGVQEINIDELRDNVEVVNQ